MNHFFYRFSQSLLLLKKKEASIFIFFKLELFHFEERRKKSKFSSFKRENFFSQTTGEGEEMEKNHSTRGKKCIPTCRPSMKFFTRSNGNKNHLRRSPHGTHGIFERFTFSVQRRTMFHGEV